MDEDLARILATGAAVASRELIRIHDLLLQHLPEDRDLRMGVASALAEIGLKIKQPAFDAHPQLKIEFEQRLEKYGVLT